MTSPTARAPLMLLLSVLLATATGCGDRAGSPGTAADSSAGPVIEDLTAAPRSAGGDDAGEEGLVAAPDFELPTIAGEPFRLAAHRGEVVLINIWATWCAPCLVEIPDFIELQEELGAEGLQIVGVSVDAEGAEVVAPFVAEMGINYPVVVDAGEVSELYGGVYTLPTTVIVDRAGRVVQKVPGMMTKDMLLPVLSDLLSVREEG